MTYFRIHRQHLARRRFRRLLTSTILSHKLTMPQLWYRASGVLDDEVAGLDPVQLRIGHWSVAYDSI